MLRFDCVCCGLLKPCIISQLTTIETLAAMSFDPLPDAGKLRELALQTMRGKGKRRRTDAADALAVEALVSLPPSSPPSLPISIPQEMVPESTNPDDVAISPLEPINNPPSSRSDCEDGEIVEDSRAGTSTPIPPQHPATLPPYLDPFINRESPHPDEIARPGYLDCEPFYTFGQFVHRMNPVILFAQ